MSTIAPTDEALTALAATPVAELLRKGHVLTHRIHEAAAPSFSTRAEREAALTAQQDLRAQRDLIDAEILGRAS